MLSEVRLLKFPIESGIDLRLEHPMKLSEVRLLKFPIESGIDSRFEQ